MQRACAKGVGVEESLELNSLVVVFAEEPSGDGWRLELQRSIEFDEQDRTLGMDTYCLVVGDEGARYGGVRGWELRENVLCLSLDPSVALELDLDEALEIEFPVGSLPAVEQMLRRILHDVAAR